MLVNVWCHYNTSISARTFTSPIVNERGWAQLTHNCSFINNGRIHLSCAGFLGSLPNNGNARVCVGMLCCQTGGRTPFAKCKILLPLMLLHVRNFDEHGGSDITVGCELVVVWVPYVVSFGNWGVYARLPFILVGPTITYLQSGQQTAASTFKQCDD